MSKDENLDVDKYSCVVKKAQMLLNQNDEWRNSYLEYAKKIIDNTDFITGARSGFHEWSPLKIYINIGTAKDASNKVTFTLRYCGQRVAELRKNRNGLLLYTTGYESDNLKYFNCNMCVRGAAWDSSEAKNFRWFFKDGPTRNNTGRNNEEHRLESLWLTEFAKTGSKDKALINIQPVTIAGVPFGMTTALSASNYPNLTYGGKGKGGGIDVLTRTGIGANTHLCIMELKDKNESTEPPIKVIKQAIVYATFIRELLRSEVGANWWKIFGFDRELPDKLVLYAACVMPSNELNDYSFKDRELSIEDDIIKLHYVYFKEAGNQIISVDTSL